MADRTISELTPIKEITPTDLFVVQQNGEAMKVTGQQLENWLLKLAESLGGIASIEPIGSIGLQDAYQINFAKADAEPFVFTVTNAKSITGVTGPTKDGLKNTYSINFNEGDPFDFVVYNGAKGEPGATPTVYIRYASQKPTSANPTFGTVPDEWIGIYSGTDKTAPASYSKYTWYHIKGAQGDTGAPASLVSSSITYQVGTSGTVIPSGSWSSTIPVVTPGNYLWTRQVLQFNSGPAITSYSVARFGMDGSGAVASVCGIGPNPDGNVPLTADHVGALSTSGGTMAGAINMNGQRMYGLNDPTSDSDAATKKYVDPFDWRYKGTAITASSTNMVDLDTYKTPGKYYITSGSLTQYLQNCPVSNDNFAMYVFVRTNDADALQQVIFTLGGLIYARGADTSGTWRSWKSGVSEETIKTLITSALEEAKASGDFKGEDGDTPVKGVDYWTAADQESIVQQVIDALGTPVFGTVNSSNDIILSGSLAEGTYTVKYEDGSGKLTTIGTLTSSGSSGGDDPGDDGSDPVEITWSNRVKLDKDTGAETTADYYAASQHIPYDPDYTYTFTVSDNALMSASACWYGSSMNYLSWNTLTNAGSGGAESGVAEPVSDAAYMRIRLYINVLPTDSEYASLLNGITLTKKKK